MGHPTPHTLIILPGWGGSQETWQAFVEIAQKEIETVRVIELPSFGNEPCPQEVWGVEAYADFVGKKIQALDLNPQEVTLLGHSFGGAVATHLVATQPELVGGLILVAAAVK